MIFDWVFDILSNSFAVRWYWVWVWRIWVSPSRPVSDKFPPLPCTLTCWHLVLLLLLFPVSSVWNLLTCLLAFLQPPVLSLMNTEAGRDQQARGRSQSGATEMLVLCWELSLHYHCWWSLCFSSLLSQTRLLGMGKVHRNQEKEESSLSPSIVRLLDV